MEPFQEVLRLKVERRKASPQRTDEIDEKVKLLELKLSHEEAVFIVKKYESDVQEIKKV